MSEMQIPDDIETAIIDLKGIGELITASEWQRAALVWAFTKEGKPGRRTDIGTDVNRYSLSDFAKLAIAGLASKTTVIKYRKAWKLATEDGFATDVKPGDLIALPDVEWADYFNRPTEKPDKEESDSGDTGAEDEESDSEAAYWKRLYEEELAKREVAEKEAQELRARYRAATNLRNMWGANGSQDWARSLFSAVGDELTDKVYRHLSKALHEDTGGSRELMQQLNEARAERREKGRAA